MYKNYKLKCIALNFAALLFLNFGYSQNHAVTIRFIGNCGLYMTDGQSNVYLDFPYRSGAHHYMEYNLAELDSIKDHPVFIYTHKHADHYSSRVKKISKKLGGQIFTPKNAGKLSELNTQLKDFTIEVIDTKHRFSFNHCSYLITWHGKKFYISGDTENAETIASYKNLDWAFVPAWIFIDALRSQISLSEVSKMFAIYHIGPRDKITNENPQIKLLDQQGEVITVPY